MSSIFTKIYNKEISGFIVDEDNDHFVLMDRFPVQDGHLLVIPKKEYENILDMDDLSYSNLLLYSQKVAKKLQKAMDSKRVGFLIEGFAINHVHVHLIPINKPSEINQSNNIDAQVEDIEKIYKSILPYFE